MTTTITRPNTIYIASATRPNGSGTTRVHLVLDGPALLEVWSGGWCGSTFVAGCYGTPKDAAFGVSMCKSYADVKRVVV